MSCITFPVLLDISRPFFLAHCIFPPPRLKFPSLVLYCMTFPRTAPLKTIPFNYGCPRHYLIMQIFFDFDWDANKARSNFQKHGVSFRLATTVFRDPLALTIFDNEHSDDEDRWVTLGNAEDGHLTVVVHTSEEVSETELRIRIISARRAEREEIRDYEQTPR